MKLCGLYYHNLWHSFGEFWEFLWFSDLFSAFYHYIRVTIFVGFLSKLLSDLHNKLAKSFIQEKALISAILSSLSNYHESLLWLFQLFLESLFYQAYHMDLFGYCEIIIINFSVYLRSLILPGQHYIDLSDRYDILILFRPSNRLFII